MRYRFAMATLCSVGICCSAASAQWKDLLGMKDDDAGAKIAHIDLSGGLLETPVTMPPLFSSDVPNSMRDILDRLKEARQDSDISAVIIDLENASLGVAQIQELHKSIRQLRAVDKPVYVHADTLHNGTYALATAATEIYLTPTGDLWLTGLYGETPYLRGLLDKINVVPDFEHCGDYKSAAETLTRTGPSAEAAEMMNWIMDGLFQALVTMISEGRGLTPDKVKKLIDGGPYSAEEALAAGLIDGVTHKQDFASKAKDRFGEDTKIVKQYGKKDPFELPNDPFAAMMQVFSMIMNPKEPSYSEPTIAIVYVEGAIQTGDAQPSPFGPSEGAYSSTIRRGLDRAAEEDAIKAVVLRINSPGGSALASEIILDAARRVAAKKPIIVSMGDVAASGGYYVTCASDTIFVQESTITASIGVVGGKLVTTGGWEKLGITWNRNQRGEMAGMMSGSTAFSDKERAKFMHYMNTVYDIFKNHVATARGSKLTKPLDQMVGGRVYTGTQALELGLVDKIGGLDDAIAYAAQKAGLGKFDTRVLPEPPTIFDMLGGASAKSDQIRLAGNGLVSPRTAMIQSPLLQAALPLLAQFDPPRVQAVLKALQRAELIRQEGVVMMMPFELMVK